MKPQIIFLLIIVLTVVSGCTNNAEKNEQLVREVVWEYIKDNEIEEVNSTNKDAWNTASVKTVTTKEIKKSGLLPGQSPIPESYKGKKVYTVRVEQSVASPLYIVDEDAKKVIGVVPGH